jgi:hypothetical protein
LDFSGIQLRTISPTNNTWILGPAERMFILSANQSWSSLMPVTARLSKKFYDAWGEALAQDLVDWFNQVDATYRADLKELNDLNFARFDAKLEQRIAQLDAKMDRQMAELRAEVRALEQRFEGRLESSLATLKADIIKWMFLFWVGTALTVIGLATTLLR